MKFKLSFALWLLLSLSAPNVLADSNEKSAESHSEDFPKKDSLEASIYRGRIVFENYCSLCHGTNADGKGRAAKLYDPRPANLVMSDKNSMYKALIIRRGGEAMGRSKFMPPWGEELTDEQIKDVVAFLYSVQKNKVD